MRAPRPPQSHSTTTPASRRPQTTPSRSSVPAPPAASRPPSLAQRGLVQRAKCYIEIRLARIDGIDDVADALGVPEEALRKTFRRVQDRSIDGYLRECRITYLKLYLSTTELDNERVAERVGFDSSETAGRAFEEATGYTMTEFQELFRRDAAS